jgi:carboxypeptidase PM20D1
VRRVLIGLLGLVGALALLAAVLVGRTLLMKPVAVEAPRTALPAIDVKSAAARLSQAIRFSTVAGERAQFEAMQIYLEGVYPLVHSKLRRERVGDNALLYTWDGRDRSAKPIALLAHQDVVPADPRGWTHAPFGGEIEGGFVWGRGALDDKGSLIATYEAIEALLARGLQPRRTMYFAFGDDEEIGGRRGAAAIVRLLASRGVKLMAVFDEGLAIADGLIPGVGKPVGLVGVAEKQSIDVELRVAGTGGHSSMPPPHTAVGVLASAIQRLEDRPMRPRLVAAARGMLEALAPEMPFMQRLAVANLWLFEPLIVSAMEAAPETAALIRSTSAATMIHGGVRPNVLPPEATATVNFRLLPGETIEAVLSHVRGAVADVRVQVTALGEPVPGRESSSDTSAFRALRAAAAQTLPDIGIAPGLVLGGTDAKHFEAIADGVYRFVPLRLSKADLPRLHGVDERIAVANLEEVCRFTLALIVALDQ